MLHIYVRNRHFYTRISYVLNEKKVLFDKYHIPFKKLYYIFKEKCDISVK